MERSHPRFLPAPPLNRTSAHPGFPQESGHDLHIPDFRLVSRNPDVHDLHVGGLVDVHRDGSTDPWDHPFSAAEQDGVWQRRQLHHVAQFDGWISIFDCQVVIWLGYNRRGSSRFVLSQ